MRMIIKDWKGDTRNTEFIRHTDGKLYCFNCYTDECAGCITGSLMPCECEHEEVE